MKSFIRYSLVILLLSCLLHPSYSRERVHVPTLSPVPPELESTYGERRRMLQRELDELKRQSGSVKSQAEQDALAAQVRDWATRAKAFNTELAAAKRALSSTELASPQLSTTQEDIERLKQLREKLEAQLAKVQKWIADGKKDQAEFEKIREDAEIDFTEDVLKHIPANEAFEKLEKLKYLNHGATVSLKVGYHALLTSISSERGLSATTDAEKLSQILDAKKSIRDLMTSGVELDPKTRKWLAGMEGLFDATGKQMGSENGIWTAAGHVIVETGTAIYPPAELLVGVDAVGEKLGQRIVIQPALTSLNEAVAGEFKAEQYLRQKIGQVDAQIAAAQAAHR